MKKAARKARESLERAAEHVNPTPRRALERLDAAKRKRDESNYHKGSCAMRLIEDPERPGAPADAWQNVEPGDFWWGREVVSIDGKDYGYRVMWAKWPDGCFGCIPIEPVPAEVNSSKYARPSWTQRGTDQAPSLSPSIHHIGHWHGYVRAGRMESV